MTESKETAGSATVVLDARAMAEAIDRMAQEIAAGNPDLGAVVLLGILKRGRPLADRLARIIGEKCGIEPPPVGSLATTLYRDDLRAGIGQIKMGMGATHFDFSVDEKTVVLVDDVLAAGRTIRAAMDEVMDYGRPARIQLACLMDRGGRELPIQPDYLGRVVGASRSEYVSVRLVESDGEDAVLVENRYAQPEE